MILMSAEPLHKAANAEGGRILEQLTLISGNVFNLSDSERLKLAQELFDNFISRREEWANADQWSVREMDLVGKKGFVKGAAVLKLRMAFAVGNSLRSYIDYLQYMVRKAEVVNESSFKSANTAAIPKPKLLQNVRSVGDALVYGPVGAGILGGEFEIWSRPNSIPTEEAQPGVSLVLGAGNQSMVTCLDVLHIFFNLKHPVLIKHHPLRPWLMECYKIMFQPLIQRGYVAQVVDEGIPVTTQILSNPLCTHVHITGAITSCTAIENTLALSRPHKTTSEITKMVTSEVGCVSPWIINPGKYTSKEFGNIAKSIVSSKKNFGGANCVAGQVIIIPQKWDLKEEFLAAVTHEFSRQPDSVAYYPGAYKRRDDIISAYPSAKVKILKANESTVSDDFENVLTEADYVAMIQCGTPGSGFNDKALTVEAFGPVMAVVELQNDDPQLDFLNKIAVPFVNDKTNIYGSLACNLVTPPATLRSDSVKQAIADLRYGMIGVNEWIALAIMASVNGGVWGANGLDESGVSGRGFVGNHYRIPCVEKIVTYRDLRLPPAFDELTQPPILFICRLGFEWACRSSMVTLAFNLFCVVVSSLFGFLLSKAQLSLKSPTSARPSEKSKSN